jgi:hypothetical protein
MNLDFNNYFSVESHQHRSVKDNKYSSNISANASFSEQEKHDVYYLDG